MIGLGFLCLLCKGRCVDVGCNTTLMDSKISLLSVFL